LDDGAGVTSGVSADDPCVVGVPGAGVADSPLDGLLESPLDGLLESPLDGLFESPLEVVCDTSPDEEEVWVVDVEEPPPEPTRGMQS